MKVSKDGLSLAQQRPFGRLGLFDFYNHVSALPYLNDVLLQVPKIVPEYLRVGDAQTAFDSLSAEQVSQLTDLLPDRWLMAHPEHRSEERQRELEIENQRRRRRRRLRRRPLQV